MAKDSRIKSKAARETARLKAEREASGQAASPERPSGLPPSEPALRGGLISRMRGGFQAVAGGKKAKKNRWLDIALWAAVIVAAAFFVARRF